VVAYGAVRKLRGTLRQHVGGNAHEACVFFSCTPAMYKPPQQAFSPHISRGYAAQQNSQPVTPTATFRFDLSPAAWYFPPAYPVDHQEAPYGTSLSDRRRRLCHPYV